MPRLLDLFCGAGGAARGYADAGFDVIGVDIAPQPRYPYEFVRADALDILRGTLDYPGFKGDVWRPGYFAAIHASPPCQSESDLRHRTGVHYADLLTPTVRALSRLSVPWVVENVASTRKLPGSLVLCGTEFGLRSGERWLKRHRRFGSNVFLIGAGGCNCAGRLIGGIYGDGGGGQQTRGWRFRSKAEQQAVMGTPWMTRVEMSQAIPPAYTRFIGEQLLAHIVSAVA